MLAAGDFPSLFRPIRSPFLAYMTVCNIFGIGFTFLVTWSGLHILTAHQLLQVIGDSQLGFLSGPSVAGNCSRLLLFGLCQELMSLQQADELVDNNQQH